MVSSCSAYGCKNRFKRGSNITFHRFPGDEKKKAKWVHVMKRVNFIPTEHSRLCSQHFHESDYIIQFGRKSLKPEAIPSVFEFPKHLQKVTPKPRSQRLRVQKESTEVTASTSASFASPLYTLLRVPEKDTLCIATELDIITEAKNQNKTTLTNVSVRIPRRKRYLVYFGDVDDKYCDTATPEKMRRIWKQGSETISKQKKKIKYLQTLNRRANAKIKTLTDLLIHLKRKNSISDENLHILQVIIPVN